MRQGWYYLGGVWGLSWATLILVSQWSCLVSFLSLGLMAAYIADWITKVAQNTMTKRNIDPKGKAVFITGCDSGFGRDLAARLDNLGFKVYAGCLMPSGEGATSLMKEATPRLKILHVDVTKDDQVRAAYKYVESDLGDDHCLWAVINNAGIANFTEIEWCPIEEYRRVYDVNSLGPIRVTKAFLPLLRVSQGRVVLVASLAGRYTYPGATAYSMSKHATVSFGDGLRIEMQKWGISVHTIEPTLYRTPISLEGPLQRAIDHFWQQCPDDIKNCYGDEYVKDFKTSVTKHLNRAKPSEKVKEVVDDMIDAVAGDNPKTRYVPSMETQIKAKVLYSLPDSMRDKVFLAYQPTTPPAQITAKRLKKKQPSLQDPREGVNNNVRVGSTGARLLRGFSMPNWTKNELTPSPKVIEEEGVLEEGEERGTVFKF